MNLVLGRERVFERVFGLKNSKQIQGNEFTGKLLLKPNHRQIFFSAPPPSPPPTHCWFFHFPGGASLVPL